MRAIDAHALGRYIADWEYTLMGFNECSGCEADLLNDVFHVIEHWPTLTDEPKWIRTEELLHGTGKAEQFGISSRMWICVRTKKGRCEIRLSRMLDGKWLYVSDGEIVTHWMPCEMPTPPSESAH